MILVPYEKSEIAEATRRSELDEQMSKVLKRNDLDDRAKFRLYQRLLELYLRHRHMRIKHMRIMRHRRIILDTQIPRQVLLMMSKFKQVQVKKHSKLKHHLTKMIKISLGIASLNRIIPMITILVILIIMLMLFEVYTIQGELILKILI